LAADYSSSDPGLVASVLERFGAPEIRGFFEGLGLRLQTEENGRVYPATNQASSVLKVLELELARLGVGIVAGFEAVAVVRSSGGFLVSSADGRKAESRSVIIAGGGRSYPALGSDGSGYKLAARFGHRVVQPVPSAVPLLVKDRMCHALQGQKMRALVESRIEGRPGRKAEGELLFTQYGLSGPAALDVSEGVSIALNRDGARNVSVVVDLAPFMSAAELGDEFLRRMEAGWAPGDLGAGILPEKFARVMPAELGEAGAGHGRGSAEEASRRLAAALKARVFAVHGTRGWNEAEFTSGGIDAREVKPRTLESKLQRGLYLAGEVLDVQGGRGGYNLAWAWASGHVAGLTE
jgi:predicted Rossmann fold flavoprotein